jgi:hypothetical protein
MASLRQCLVVSRWLTNKQIENVHLSNLGEHVILEQQRGNRDRPTVSRDKDINLTVTTYISN